LFFKKSDKTVVADKTVVMKSPSSVREVDLLGCGNLVLNNSVQENNVNNMGTNIAEKTTLTGNPIIKPLLSRSNIHNTPHISTYDMSNPLISEYFNYDKDIGANFAEFQEIFYKFQHEISKNKNVKRKIKPKNHQYIKIHNSFISLKVHENKTSKIIDPKNPFKKDEDLINYDKDSEEELMEEVIII